MPKQNKHGFTLIELLIVIAIIAILAAVAFVAIDPAKRLQESHDAQRLSDAKTIVEALKLYSLDHGGFPSETDGYGGQIGIGNDIDSLLENYLGYVPADPKHDGTEYYYYYDPNHLCSEGGIEHYFAIITIYNFESPAYQAKYSNFSEICGGWWGSEGGNSPTYTLILESPDH